MSSLSYNLPNKSLLRTRPALSRAVILVADDDEDTRVMFRTMLQLQGYRVIEASDGEQTVQLAERARPDLILMDVGLPGVDGLDATRRIRRFGSAPIIIISGHAEDNFLAQARQAGCDEYLVKPIDLDKLEEMVRKYTAEKARACGAV
jgi:CheY-like chemotaxis protein